MAANKTVLRPFFLLATFGFSASLLWSGATPTAQGRKDFPTEPPILTAKPLQSAPGDEEVTKLLKALYNERLKLTALHYENLKEGVEEDTEALVDSARRLVRSGLEIYQRPQEKIDFLKRIVELSAKAEMIFDWMGKDLRLKKKVTPESRDVERLRLSEFKLELQVEMLRVKKAADGGRE